MSKSPTKAVRGEVTREALVDAAMEVFGRDGFHAASTRAIARAAGANQALIGYHFGGTERLYLTVFEHIAGRMEELLGTRIANVEAALQQPQTTHPAALLIQLSDGFAAMMLRDETARWAQLILHEQQAPSAAFDILYTRIIGRALALMSDLVARVHGRDVAGLEDRLTAITIMGQALVFRAARAAVMRHLDWTRVSDADVTAIRRQLQRNIAAMLQLNASELMESK